ncbi:MAG: tetratricopeptide repeat protein [Chthoniobacterales bacterium]
MRATYFPSPSGPDRTYLIAVVVAAVLGGCELLAVGVHYAQVRAARKAAEAPVVAAAASPAPSVAAPSTANPATTPAPGASTVPQTVPSNAALSAAERLLQEAASLRARGDTTNALARLQDAAQRDPKNANVLAEMAMIYESIQLFDRSNAAWQKIQEIGPSAGALYELADMKLKVGASAPPAATSAGPGFAGVSPLDAGTTRANPDGIPDGSTFGITEATVTENPDADAETNLTLRVGVKVRANTVIDHTKVKIQVYFYDSIDNSSKYALTDAEVNYEWITPNHDWKSTNPEILAMSYVRLKNGAVLSDAALAEAAANVTPPTSGRRAGSTKKPAADASNRKFGGYQIRVYYNDQLQDVRAEPTKLLNLFAPPLNLQGQ